MQHAKPVVTRYREFLINVQRNSAQHSLITIIDSPKLSQFVKFVCADSQIDVPTRILTAIIAGAGLRISEVLELTVDDLNYKGTYYEFRPLVLKQVPVGKGNRLYRTCQTPDCLTPLLTEYLKSLKPGARLFPFTRQATWHKFRNAFGGSMCNHSFRHSYISYLHHKGEDVLSIQDIMKVSQHVVPAYAHITDISKKLRNIKVA